MAALVVMSLTVVKATATQPASLIVMKTTLSTATQPVSVTVVKTTPSTAAHSTTSDHDDESEDEDEDLNENFKLWMELVKT